MGAIDRALARAYALRPAKAATPTRDHLPAEPPAPHFPVTAAPMALAEVEFAPNSGAEVALRWPETVRALERGHGERFEQLADALIEARNRHRQKVLLFTSCHRAEGRTTLVLTLARALARRPGRTLLVDGDLGGPMLGRQLGFRPRAGLDDVVGADLPLDEALVEAPDDHLTILPLRAPVARPRDFLASPGWACLMARVRREFDTVLIDGSPLFAGLSAAVLHRSVDAAILVHNRALTGERALLRAREILEAGGVPLLGLAETFV